MGYNNILEVMGIGGNRISIPIEGVCFISETPDGCIIAVAGADDVESSESYDLLKIRYEQVVDANHEIADDVFDSRFEKRSKNAR